MKFFGKTQVILIAVALGLVFPFFAWMIELAALGLDFNFESIKEIHRNNHTLYLINLLPVFLVGLAFILQHYFQKQNSEFEKLNQQLSRQIQNIEHVSTFAEHIGQGRYDIDFQVVDDQDHLGKTLQNLRNKLYENNQKESLQNWEMVGKDKISQVLRLHNDVDILTGEVLETLIKYIDVAQGVFYIYDDDTDLLKISASYAYNRKKYLKSEIRIGEGLVGQAAIERDIVHRTEIPSYYLSITSGILGEKKPDSILIVPLFMEEKLQGVFEFASLRKFKPYEIEFVKGIAEIVARTIYNLKITDKTETLLRESQEMTQELKENEEELRQNAEEMRLTQEELEKTNAHLEEKILEVNQSQKRVHSLLENASELILIYDSNKNLSYVSPSVINILGYTEDEMIAGKDFERITKKGQQALNQMFQDLFDKPDQAQKVQYTYLNKQGAIIHLETTGRNLLNDPSINGLLLNTSDITERKRAEKEQRMRGQMQTLSDNSPDIILRIDLGLQFFYVNPAIEYYSGIKAESFNKRHLNEVGLNDEIVETISQTAKELIESKSKVQKEIFFPFKEQVRIMNMNAIPEFNEEGKMETVLFIFHDITELKKIEAEIKVKNAKITDSINYAFRLQNAILPNQKIIKEAFPDSFMFYRPRDIVSGDFPWYYEKGDDKYIAVIDCTGHGVPGAMLSLIGYFLMNQIVSHPTDINPGEILTKLHLGVQQTLRQDKEGASARDGMDIALCKINMKEMELQFAGAHRPLYLVRQGELIEYKGTRTAIGGITKEGKPEPSFENNVIKINKDDAIYFFSDGLPDQFGGPEGKKYFPKRIREHVLNNKDLPMNQIYQFFRKDFQYWLGDEEPIDDILLIGIRF